MGLCFQKCVSAEKSEQHEHDVGAKTYENGVACYFACTLKILFSKASGEQGVYSNACAYAYSDYQKLDRVCKGEGVYGIFAYVLNCIICYPAYEIAVNDIVKRLNYH